MAWLKEFGKSKEEIWAEEMRDECNHSAVVGNIINGFKCERCCSKIGRITFIKRGIKGDWD